MATLSKSRPQIGKAEDLANIFSAQTRWNTLRECERAVFLSLDLSSVLRSKITLLKAMELQVGDIIADAFGKGILERLQDGSIAVKTSWNRPFIANFKQKSHRVNIMRRLFLSESSVFYYAKQNLSKNRFFINL